MVGFVLGTCHILQRDTGKEDLPPLFSQLVVNVLCHKRIPCTLTAGIGFFIADENIIMS